MSLPFIGTIDAELRRRAVEAFKEQAESGVLGGVLAFPDSRNPRTCCPLGFLLLGIEGPGLPVHHLTPSAAEFFAGARLPEFQDTLAVYNAGAFTPQAQAYKDFYKRFDAGEMTVDELSEAFGVEA